MIACFFTINAVIGIIGVDLFYNKIVDLGVGNSEWCVVAFPHVLRFKTKVLKGNHGCLISNVLRKLQIVVHGISINVFSNFAPPLPVGQATHIRLLADCAAPPRRKAPAALRKRPALSHPERKSSPTSPTAYRARRLRREYGGSSRADRPDLSCGGECATVPPCKI